MERNFFYRKQNRKGCYCSKCGKRQLQDLYNARKHAVVCGFDAKDYLVDFIDEDKCLGYSLIADQDRLYLDICKPELKLIRGFTDRYHGAEWVPVFRAEFRRGSKKISIPLNETEHDLEYFLKQIRQKDLFHIQRESDVVIIHKVFPSILGVYSLEMFSHIYTHKGFRYEPIPQEEARSIRFAMKENPGTDSLTNPLSINAKIFKVGSRTILAVTIPWKTSTRIFLFSENYVSVNRFIDLPTLFARDLDIDSESLKAIIRFDSIYPGNHLREYLENPIKEFPHSKNIFIPLLSSDYHILQELTAKAGMDTIAHNLSISAYELPPSRYKNIPEAFGCSVAILKKMSPSAFTPGTPEMLQNLYNKVPAYLEVPVITDKLIEFIADSNLTGTEPAAHIAGAANWTTDDILKMIRYISSNLDLNYILYRDYLQMCGLYGTYIEGLVPSDLRTAHLQIMALQEISVKPEEKARFHTAVFQPAYQWYRSDLNEEDLAYFEEDDYMVIAPYCIEDLYREGKEMHNCVFTYLRWIQNATTGIYFLRKKDNPEKSFGTLEVKFGPRPKLIQAKAFANSMLPKDAQAFVKKWTAMKQIHPFTADLR